MDSLPKFCPRCEETKTRGDFYPLRTRREGIQGYCKTCMIRLNTEANKKKPRYVKFVQARNHDRHKGLATCNKEEWLQLLPEGAECSYCGSLENVGLDRIENELGHEVGNLVLCCYGCNITRGDRFSHAEMLMYLAPALRQIRENREGKLKQINDGLRTLGLFT